MEIVFSKREVVAAMKMIEKNGTTFIRNGKDHLEMAREMMNVVDVDGNGLIDINEFIDMMKKETKLTLKIKDKYRQLSSHTITECLNLQGMCC